MNPCARLTHKIDKGLDLTGEIQALLKQHTGDVIMTPGAFAICLSGPGSEGGPEGLLRQFAAARNNENVRQTVGAIDAFAASRSATLAAGANLSREDAYRRMRAHGYRTTMQGVAMQRPHADGFNRADAWVIDDWR